MRLRQDIAALLQSGMSDRAITLELHVGHKTVARTRAALGLPCRPGGPKTAPLAELFDQRTRDAGNGHLDWTGTVRRGIALLTYTDRADGKRQDSARRIGFRLLHGRDPVGNITSDCGYEGCVAPAHLEDRPMREKNRTTFAAIFGSLP